MKFFKMKKRILNFPFLYVFFFVLLSQWKRWLNWLSEMNAAVIGFWCLKNTKNCRWRAFILSSLESFKGSFFGIRLGGILMVKVEENAFEEFAFWKLWRVIVVLLLGMILHRFDWIFELYWYFYILETSRKKDFFRHSLRQRFLHSGQKDLILPSSVQYNNLYPQAYQNTWSHVCQEQNLLHRNKCSENLISKSNWGNSNKDSEQNIRIS